MMRVNRRRQWGVLFSHAHNWVVEGPFTSSVDAGTYAGRVARAVGVEYVLVFRESPDSPWVYGRDRVSPREIGERKWVR